MNAKQADVIILDDDPEIGELFSNICEIISLSCQRYTDPELFLEGHCSAGQILVMDLNMPGIDGLQVLRKLADKEVKCPTILTSGLGERILSSSRKVAESHGIHIIGFLPKPFSIKESMTLLQQAKVDLEERSLARVPVAGDAGRKLPPPEFTEQQIYQGLQLQQFLLHFQPQLDLTESRIFSCEALVRWQHPEYGLLYPDAFIQQVEKSDFVDEFTWYTFSEACKAIRQFEQAGLDIRVSVNMPPELVVASSIDRLEEILDLYKVPSNKVVIEITERGVMDDLTDATEVLTRMSMKGLQIAIDDFGTGNSSLKQLEMIPFKELKIDSSFVIRGLESGTRAIISNTAKLAHALDMHVVVEGVETKEMLDYVRSLNCEYVQGYFISRPVDSASFISFVQNYHANEHCLADVMARH